MPRLSGSLDDGPTGEGFHAVRGTGQGDVTSPTCWAAIFDILLTALHMDIQDACPHVSSEANRGYGEGETAYADDLLSCARTPEALQRKADIVSTFCMIMGFQLPTSKLRRFVMAHSGMEDNEPPTTIIHRYTTTFRSSMMHGHQTPFPRLHMEFLSILVASMTQTDQLIRYYQT